MIRSILFEPNKPPENLNTLPEIQAKKNNPNGYIWVSLESSNNAEMDEILRATFNFHPLAIEDCQINGYQTSKVDDFVDYLFIIAHALKKTGKIYRY